jgi:hypothetical protein
MEDMIILTWTLYLPKVFCNLEKLKRVLDCEHVGMCGPLQFCLKSLGGLIYQFKTILELHARGNMVP